MKREALSLGDTISGEYYGLTYEGIIDGLSGQLTMVRLTKDLLRDNGAVKYPAGEGIALDPWQMTFAKLVSKGSVDPDQVRYLDGHVWI